MGWAELEVEKGDMTNGTGKKDAWDEENGRKEE